MEKNIRLLNKTNMKSKEEIERLATEYSAIGKEAGLTHMEYTLEKIGYTNGYTQCQKDMADRKYTEEDMLKFANQYSSINILHLKEHLKEFTLNKQD